MADDRTTVSVRSLHPWGTERVASSIRTREPQSQPRTGDAFAGPLNASC
jgi:hypothetical protein